jgi:pimeloyl-ACP methyl ester carboxylesterase
LHLQTIGAGEPILFVHGSFGDGSTWDAQRPLANHYRLLLLDRRGFGESPPRTSSYGFDEEAHEVAPYLGDGTHLVGLSYGGVISLLVAALRPDAVRSLTVAEPPAFRVAAGDADAEDFVARMEPIYLAAQPTEPEAFRAAFLGVFGARLANPTLTSQERRNAQATMLEAFPWRVEMPLTTLAAAPFPKLVVSGSWGGPSDSPRERAGRAFDAVCRVLAARIGAEFTAIPGGGHNVPSTGTPFNERLEALFRTAGL